METNFIYRYLLTYLFLYQSSVTKEENTSCSLLFIKNIAKMYKIFRPSIYFTPPELSVRVIHPIEVGAHSKQQNDK